jgi:alkylation response protein AidB-like acyl-CoA dehydrogenase
MYPIYAYGSDGQKEKWLPPMARGEKLGCFGLTEPDFGSNPSGMRTRAVKSGNEYILNGEKMWITSGSIADIAIVWAKSEEHNDRIKGFLVETDRPGFKASDVHGQVRKQFRDQPIASHQLVQEKLAWMISEITKAQLLVLQVGRLKDANKVGHQHISMAKRNNVWMALECARMARDILGANGIADDYPVMRHMMNLESVKTYEGTHDIHALIIGESVTGISAF